MSRDLPHWARGREADPREGISARAPLSRLPTGYERTRFTEPGESGGGFDRGAFERHLQEEAARAAEKQAQRDARQRQIEDLRSQVGSLRTQQQGQLDLLARLATPPADQQFGVPYNPVENPFVAPDFDFSPVPFEQTTEAIAQPTRTGGTAAFSVPRIQERGAENQPRGVERATEENRNVVTRRPIVGGPVEQVIASRLTRNRQDRGRF